MAWHSSWQTPYSYDPYNQYNQWNNYAPPPPQYANLQPPPPPHHRPHRSHSYGNAPPPIINNYGAPSPPRGRSPRLHPEEVININVGEHSRSRSRSRGYTDAVLLDMERDLFLRRRPSGAKKEKVDEEAIIAKWQRKEALAQQEREQAEIRAVEEFERKQKEQKEEHKRIVEAAKQKELADKAAEERKFAEFEALQRERKLKAENEAKEKEEELEREMRKRLERSHLSQRAIDRLVAKEAKDAKSQELVLVGDRALMVANAHTPKYPMIDLKYIEIGTLKYYGLDWEYSATKHNHIIIRHDLSRQEVDRLFEHTRRMREGTLLIEEKRGRKKKDNGFMVVKSRSKSRGKDVTRIEIREK